MLVPLDSSLAAIFIFRRPAERCGGEISLIQRTFDSWPKLLTAGLRGPLARSLSLQLQPLASEGVQLQLAKR
jgi:hypothetical protein